MNFHSIVQEPTLSTHTADAPASKLVQLGFEAEQQGRLEEAADYYRRGLALYSADRQQYYEAHIHLRMGLLAEARERKEEAQNHLVKSLVFFLEIEDEDNARLAFSYLAQIWQLVPQESAMIALHKAADEIFGVDPEIIEWLDQLLLGNQTD